MSFADTFAVFEDPNALTLDQIVSGEERYVTIGMDAFGRVLVVVYTWRGDKIRIISARKAVRSEARQYESAL
ncbi:MAG: BrnT family toxin [Pseudomonadota bacterium]|nr:BrnT family toxin [Pseudomonadota bacterium]